MIAKYEGCLLGLAIGDALGAPVEFLTLDGIKMLYGKNGVTDFHDWNGFPIGSYTDDTQMALATAQGCLNAYERWENRGICNVTFQIYKCYLEWLEFQSNPKEVRGPGNTCIKALQSGKMGTLENRINDRKGCGGVMRTAPIGLTFPPDKAFQQGAECAAITHGHPSGYLSAGFLSEMISLIIDGKTLDESIDLSIKQLIKYEGYEETLDKVKQACELANTKKSVINSIQEIGGGWVGEEALAISIYCSLKFSDNWEKGVLASVNHSGDSDSTGAITGAILGALIGIKGIPEKLVRDVENCYWIKKLAIEMFNKFRN